LFNTVIDGKKLKTEAWINLGRVKDLGEEIEETVDRLLEGEIVEISTGLFSDIEEEEGRFGGKEYSGVWRNVVPDHLAVLSKGKIGACSLADGCGANRANQKEGVNKMGEEEKKKKDNVASNSKSGNNGGDDETEIRSFFEKLKGFMGFKVNKDLSHNSIRSAIESVLGDEEGFSFIVDVFKSHFIVQKEGRLFSRKFNVTEGGRVKLGSESIPVRFEAGFVELITNEVEMDKDKFVKELIANEASQFDKDDEEWLSELDEKQLQKLVPLEKKEEVKANELKKTLEEKEGHGGVKANEKKPEEKKEEKEEVTLKSYIADAPREIQEILNSGLRAHSSNINGLIEAIKANSRNRFSEDQLKSFNLETLENLAVLAAQDDYIGRGTPRENAAEDDQLTVPEPLNVFDLDKARKAS
jgi:hypothetical protein